MHNLKLTKITFTALFASVVMIGFTSCASQPDDTQEMAEKQNDLTFDDRDTKRAADYLIDATTMLQKNVRWGELASTKTTLKEVKELGTSMAKYDDFIRKIPAEYRDDQLAFSLESP